VRHASRGLLAVAVLLMCTMRAAAAEWQLKPFIGLTYGGNTSYNIVQLFPPRAHFLFGASGMLLGEFLGIEGDFGHTSGFFQDSNNPLVTDSGVTTTTGNIVLALPRHLAEYTLRPYIVGGAGVMHIRIDYQQNVPNSSTLKAMDLGAGVTGFLTKRMGVSWDVRYFRSIDRTIESGQSVGPEHLSFWRASMAFAIRL
jgi:Outer membrane protein beta-barrel domain